MEITSFETNALLIRIDELEQQLKEADKIQEEYKEIKEQLKKSMVEIGKKYCQDKVKWITPGGTQITCSIGKPATFKEEIREELSTEMLREKFPEAYQACLIAKKHSVCTSNATNDTLRITLKKEGK